MNLATKSGGVCAGIFAAEGTADACSGVRAFEIPFGITAECVLCANGLAAAYVFAAGRTVSFAAIAGARSAAARTANRGITCGDGEAGALSIPTDCAAPVVDITDEAATCEVIAAQPAVACAAVSG